MIQRRRKCNVRRSENNVCTNDALREKGVARDNVEYEKDATFEDAMRLVAPIKKANFQTSIQVGLKEKREGGDLCHKKIYLS